MELKIKLPFKEFALHKGVTRIVAENAENAFDILPQSLDCITALTPGILTFETRELGKVCVAVDEGILIKAGTQVLVSVRAAFGGAALIELREAVKTQSLILNEQQTEMRATLDKLEIGFLWRFSKLSLN